MRLLIISNAPFAGTGYGVQTALLAPRLRDAGHEVAILAYWGLEGARLEFEGMPVFPRSRHPASQDFMLPLANELGCAAIISITDAWVIETARFEGSEIAHVPWFPCDCEPMDAANARGIAGPGPKVRLPIATSQHAGAMARMRGITDQRTIHYMIDPAVYCPGDKRAAREGWGIPQDAFVVGIVAMNKVATGIDRKRFFEQIGAFAKLRRRHPEAVLYIHSHMVAPDGVAIPEILTHWQVPSEAVIATNGLVLTCGAPPPLMADLYRSFDVLLGATGGEGAGMPLLEAAGCGTPSISGDWTAMPEYAKSGWVLSRDEAQPEMNMGRTIWQKPNIDAIAGCLEKAFDASDAARAQLAAGGIKGAAEHDADKTVTEAWLPALAEVEDRIERSEQVQDVEIPEVLRPPAQAVSA